MTYSHGRKLRVRRAKRYQIYKRPRQTNIINPLFVIAVVMATFLMGSLAGIHLNFKKAASEPIVSAEPISVPVENQLAMQPTTKIQDVDQIFHIEPEVQKFIETYAKQNSANGLEWSIYVQGLGGDTRLAMYDANKQQTIASLYKLFLIRPLSLRLSPDKWENKKLGEKSIKQCVIEMIQISDNDCAHQLRYYLKDRIIDNQLHSDSYLHTELNRKNEPAVGTAKDTASLLERLYNYDGYDSGTRQVILDAMKNQKYRDGIPRICNTSCTVYNKTGDLNGYHNDAAIIESKDKAYTMVIISKGGSWEQISSLADGIHQRMFK